MRIIAKVEKRVPSIFSRTIYGIPNDEELREVNSCGLTCDEIISGFEYTIIGRGMKSKKNSQMIMASIARLCELFPDNGEYAKAHDKYKLTVNF